MPIEIKYSDEGSFKKVGGTPEQQQARRVWVDALRAGTRKQAKGMLQEVDNGRPFTGGFCCLGVACDVRDPKGWNELSGRYLFGPTAADDVLDKETAEWLGISDDGAFGYALDVQWETDQEVPIVEILNGDYYSSFATANSLVELNDDIGFSFEQIADVVEAMWEVAPAEVTK